ncbi:MAG: bifunctional glutamate N-acetyltransferase/amino-acid acetyltransferase ArgJ [bacterium]
MKVEERIVLPKKFRAAGVAANIKRSGAKDMALIVSDTPAVAAGLFTTNQVKAATVRICLQRIARQRGRAIIANSGNANACTGAQGLRDADAMTDLTAKQLGIDKQDVYVCSTGSIGTPLPMDKIRAGIEKLAPTLRASGGNNAAESICTTDRWPKIGTVRLRIGGKPVIVTAMAKGAGMIEPNMATMLCFVLTDAAVRAVDLQHCLRDAVKESFNRISVDGNMSTNDAVLFFANGAAGNKPLTAKHRDWKTFCAAVQALTLKLALSMVRDGEGATKVIAVHVKNARNDREADFAARAVANSLLVKTSWAGDYPNWGRIMDAIGYSKAKVAEDKVDIAYGTIVAVKRGISAGADVHALSRIQKQERFDLTINLRLGKGNATVYTCDIGHEYVDVNVDYIKMPGKTPT